MRIAVITPYAGEGLGVLERCLESVSSQSVPATHVVVADGSAVPAEVTNGRLNRPSLDVIHLPCRSGDAGATPRAIGSAYALQALSCDALAFLDADNTWAIDHLRRALEHVDAGAEVVSARRWLLHCETDCILGVDVHDSDGVHFTDTNCLVLAGSAMEFARLWRRRDLGERLSLGATTTGFDRRLWNHIRGSLPQGKFATIAQPTVFYRTAWWLHYRNRPDAELPTRGKVMELVDGCWRSEWARVRARRPDGAFEFVLERDLHPGRPPEGACAPAGGELN